MAILYSQYIIFFGPVKTYYLKKVMKTINNDSTSYWSKLPYSKRAYIWLLVIWFFASTWVFLGEYGQFMLWLLIILCTLSYKEISLRIASWSKKPTSKEYILISLIIFIYFIWHGLLWIEYSTTAIPFWIVFVNYTKPFLPKSSKWKSDVILIIISIIFIILAMYLAWIGTIFNYYFS